MEVGLKSPPNCLKYCCTLLCYRYLLNFTVNFLGERLSSLPSLYFSSFRDVTHALDELIMIIKKLHFRFYIIFNLSCIFI